MGMGLRELALTLTLQGVGAASLGELRDAYIVDHPELLGRKRNSRPLMQKIQAALLEDGILIWPSQLGSLEAKRMVYLVRTGSALGEALVILDKMEPNQILAEVILSKLRFAYDAEEAVTS
ncbi:hypothetical protein OUY22_02535 [Nonomuraea sp. MCN248]|uniref:Uncharacterized protein n=1 Tax=Nonomuraea corallina TaxID=2989783 RepID=A0ABT4S5T0_9ACTN|nr:hypothetical protein [Nonomuraea corallina]MDA0632280.1 hypothetical protein [Nonomuraea corallina]